MSDYLVQFDEAGYLQFIKNTNADKRIRHARAHDRVKFDIPSESGFRYLTIQKGGVDDRTLFGTAVVGFYLEHEIQPTAEGDYTFTPNKPPSGEQGIPGGAQQVISGAVPQGIPGAISQVVLSPPDIGGICVGG